MTVVPFSMDFSSFVRPWPRQFQLLPIYLSLQGCGFRLHKVRFELLALGGDNRDAAVTERPVVDRLKTLASLRCCRHGVVTASVYISGFNVYRFWQCQLHRPWKLLDHLFVVVRIACVQVLCCWSMLDIDMEGSVHFVLCWPQRPLLAVWFTFTGHGCIGFSGSSSLATTGCLWRPRQRCRRQQGRRRSWVFLSPIPVLPSFQASHCARAMYRNIQNQGAD